jgi:hypothetical protein
MSAANAIERLSLLFGRNYKLTFIARCISPDGEDALVTDDTLDELRDMVAKRIAKREADNAEAFGGKAGA